MAKRLGDFFIKPEGQAYPGDTYLDDLKRSSKVGKVWARALFIGVAFGFGADLYFLHDTVDVAFDNASWDLLSVLSWVVAATLVLLYLFIGHIIGKKLQEFKAFGTKSSLGSAFVAIIVIAIAIASLTLFRLSTELDAGLLSVAMSFFSYFASSDYVIEVSKVFVMTLVMFLSAFLSAIHAYYAGDAVSAAVFRASAAALPADRALYNKVFFEHSNDIAKEREYEERERDLDKQAIASAFKLGSLASQLNGMVDPADAYEFIEAQRAITADYFNGGAR